MSADAAMLAEIPLFALLDGAERFTLAGLLELTRWPRGALLFQQGDLGDRLYIIRSGRVRIFVVNTIGERLVLGEPGPGEVIGELSLLDGGPRTAGAEVIEEAELLEMDRDVLLEIVRRHPHAALDLLAVIAGRLRSTSEHLRTIVARNLNVVHEEKLTLGERLADRVAAFGGSWTFIGFFGAVLLGWMAINVFLLVGRSRFDPYPFILLNLVLSTLAALQAPVIMMSQNRQAAKDRMDADLDFEVNRKAELEIAHLHAKVDRMHEALQRHLAGRDGRDPGRPP